MTRTNTTVAGETYQVYGDFIKRGTMATRMSTGETKQISHSGYISNDLTVRKAIATAFDLPTYRTKPTKAMQEATAERDLTLQNIAEIILHIETLETRYSDSLDFHEVSAWGLKEALQAAYQAGQGAAKANA